MNKAIFPVIENVYVRGYGYQNQIIPVKKNMGIDEWYLTLEPYFKNKEGQYDWDNLYTDGDIVHSNSAFNLFSNSDLKSGL